jgi:hypothetical protein
LVVAPSKLVIDPLHLEARVQVVTCGRFIGMQHGALGNTVLHPEDGLAL